MDFTLKTYKDQIIEALGGLMRIESVKAPPLPNMPYGKGVFDALLYMMNLAGKLDFDSVNVFSHMGYVEYGEGDEVFAVLTHLDVVPAGENWTMPPFDCTVRDGRIYGRGAVDNKGPAIISLFALHALKENCKNLKKRVRLIFGCDEESGWSDMRFYREHEPEEPLMAISPDANFPIINAEKGLLQLNISKELGETPKDGLVLLSIGGGDRVNVVPNEAVCVLRGRPDMIGRAVELYNASAKDPLTLSVSGEESTIRSYGKASHGSRPQDGVNALAYLIAFLNTLPLQKSGVSDLVYALGDFINTEYNGQRLGLDVEDFSGKLTLNLGAVKMEDGRITALVDIRHPVKTKKEAVREKITRAFGDFEIEEAFSLPAHYVEEDSAFIRKLKEAYEEVTGEDAYCISMGGATYARVFKNSVAFGPIFPGEPGTEHQPDEHISIDSLLTAGDIIANAILKLCT